MRRFFAGDLIDGDVALYRQFFFDKKKAKKVARGLAKICPHGDIHLRRGGWVVCRVNSAAESLSMTTFTCMVMAAQAGVPDEDEDMKFLSEKLDTFRIAAYNRKRLPVTDREPSCNLIRYVKASLKYSTMAKGGKK